MSVMPCNRNGCENIMCNRYSRNYGYICDECFEELVAHGSEQNIDDFLESEKPEDDEDARKDRKFFENESSA